MVVRLDRDLNDCRWHVHCRVVRATILLRCNILLSRFSFPIHLPWYGLLLALSICGTLFVPIGIVMAITNQQSSLYLICQLICGGAFPGRPVANMVFVTYGYVSVVYPSPSVPMN
jgi:hypothetical protein